LCGRREYAYLCRLLIFTFDDLDLGKKNIFNNKTFIREEFIQLIFEDLFDLGTLGTDLFSFVLAKSTGNTASGVRTDDFRNEVIAYVLPELWSIGFVEFKKNGTSMEITLPSLVVATIGSSPRASLTERSNRA